MSPHTQQHSAARRACFGATALLALAAAGTPKPGVKSSFAYAMAGRLGRLKASGTFQVKMAQTDAAGAITANV
jgi:hypothetical protein